MTFTRFNSATVLQCY